MLGEELRAFVKRHSDLGHRLVASSMFTSTGITVEWIPEFRDTPVFPEYLRWYRDRDPKMLTYLYTFLVFGKKLSFVDENLNTTALRGWLEVEERLSDLVLDDEVTSVLKRIVRGLVPYMPETPLSPHYGPKSVAEHGVWGNVKKSCNLFYEASIDRAFFGSHIFSVSNPVELGYHAEAVIPDHEAWYFARNAPPRTAWWHGRKVRRSGQRSELLFVPKDVTKSRSICREPNVFMWAQQAVLRRLLEGMKSGRVAERFIDLADQSKNRRLAQYGSLTGEIDTIDLSSASDSVSVDLVKRIFPNDVLYWLLATRTSKVLIPTGETVSVKKFAPMGSALCFPTQCLVFTSVVIYCAIQKACGLVEGEYIPHDSPYLRDIGRTVRKLFRRRPGQVAYTGDFEPATVYGDDICVDRRLTPLVIPLLSSLGFSVNTGKSFRGDQAFRESCGGYYFNGGDVTPLYFRVQNHQSVGIEADVVASLVACANNAGDKRFFCVRRRLIHYLLTARLSGVRQFHGRNPIAFTSDKLQASYIYCKDVRNDHLKVRSHASLKRETDYQIDDGHECYQFAVRDVYQPRSVDEADLSDVYLHTAWWDSRWRGEASPEFSTGASHQDTRGTRLIRGWIPW